MSDTSQGPGWWEASDGKWYPPADATQAPGPGWWLASDGKWYPPADAGADAPARSRPKPAVAPPLGTSPSTARSERPASSPPPAATPAPAKPAASAPAPTTPSPAPAPKPAVAPAAKAVAPEPAAADDRPAVSTPVKPVATPDDSAAPDAEQPEIRRPSWGLSADQQIAIRNNASRADARAVAAARFAAASRLLESLEQDDPPASSRELRENPAMGDPAPAIPAAALEPPPTAAPPPPVSPPAPAAEVPPPPQPPVAPEPATASSPGALLEVKPPTLTTDPAHIGERLVIFGDRVELHDRSDRVRQVILGNDIVDVVVHKRFTGATVTVDSIDGTSIVAKGLSPDKAEKVREIIQRRTRQTKPAEPDRPRPTRPESEPEAATEPASALDAADLLDMLAALHDAGVLTDAELVQKQALVARLAPGHPLAATGSGS